MASAAIRWSQFALCALSLVVTPACLRAAGNELGVEIHKILIEKFPKMQVGLTLLDRTGRTLKGLEARTFRVF